MRIDISPGGAARQLRSASPALKLFGRAGYAAKGVVYVVIGVLAARAALGKGGATTDSEGALSVIGNGPFGSAVLALIAIGLFGYMAWRLVAAVTDAEGKGDKPTSLAVRAAQAGRGLIYGGLALEALRQLSSRNDSSSEPARDWTARVLEWPLGPWLVGAAGLGVLGYAGYQLYRASSKKKVQKHLDLGEAGASQATWIVRLGQFGIAARAVVFAMIGVFIVRAARQSDPSEAGGISQSLRALWDTEYGKAVLTVVGLGLVAYGLYQIATARYRRMRAVG